VKKVISAGLGLYIARTLVEMNGGRIHLGPAALGGTAFEVVLLEAGWALAVPLVGLILWPITPAVLLYAVLVLIG
jgi:hypothetical protein